MGAPAAFVGSGGSIPIAGYFKTMLGMDAMLIGFGRDDDQIHSARTKNTTWTASTRASACDHGRRTRWRDLWRNT
jgi:hypothetical protein